MTALNPRHAVYLGSFDPFTLGHQDIVQRAARLFDRLTVGIGINPDKKPLFTPDERLAMCRDVLSPLPNVDVACFESLAVEFLRSIGAGVVVRGLRTLSDIESEFTMALANRSLDPEMDTVFLMASEKFTHVSSTLIKQVALMGHGSAEGRLGGFVPAAVVAPLIQKFQSPHR